MRNEAPFLHPPLAGVVERPDEFVTDVAGVSR